jgi:hypothetical protein
MGNRPRRIRLSRGTRSTGTRQASGAALPHIMTPSRSKHNHAARRHPHVFRPQNVLAFSRETPSECEGLVGSNDLVRQRLLVNKCLAEIASARRR